MIGGRALVVYCLLLVSLIHSKTASTFEYLIKSEAFFRYRHSAKIPSRTCQVRPASSCTPQTCRSFGVIQRSVDKDLKLPWQCLNHFSANVMHVTVVQKLFVQRLRGKASRRNHRRLDLFFDF